MNKKRFISLILCFIIICSNFSNVIAANFDFYHSNDVGIDMDYYDVLNSDRLYYYLLRDYDKYFQEFNGKYYLLKNISDYRVANREASTADVIANIDAYIKTIIANNENIIDNIINKNKADYEEDSYTSESWANYQNALTKVQELRSYRFIKEEILNQKKLELENTFLELELANQLETKELEALVLKSDSFKVDDYTIETATAYLNAIEEARNLLANIEYKEQRDVDTLVDKINEAMENLKTKPKLPVIENLSPTEDQDVRIHDKVTISFNSSKGGEAGFKIALPGSNNSVKLDSNMKEISPGYYEGEFTVPKGFNGKGFIIFVSFTDKNDVTVFETAQGKINIEDEPRFYTVTFVDYNGTKIDEQIVEHGSSPTTPLDPNREGYRFTGWDIKFDNVTSDLTVTAQWEINTYTVIFKDHDGSVLKIEEVKHGSVVTAPPNSTREGYTFVGWYFNESLEAEFDFATEIKSDTTIYTKWESVYVTYQVNITGNGAYIDEMLTSLEVLKTLFEEEIKEEAKKLVIADENYIVDSVEIVEKTITISFDKDPEKWLDITINKSENGNLRMRGYPVDEISLNILRGTSLSEVITDNDMEISAHTGFIWDKPDEFIFADESSSEFTVEFVKNPTQWVTIVFRAGENGNLLDIEGNKVKEIILEEKMINTSWGTIKVPQLSPDVNYELDNWDPTLGAENEVIGAGGIYGERVFTASFKEIDYGSFNIQYIQAKQDGEIEKDPLGRDIQIKVVEAVEIETEDVKDGKIKVIAPEIDGYDLLDSEIYFDVNSQDRVVKFRYRPTEETINVGKDGFSSKVATKVKGIADIITADGDILTFNFDEDTNTLYIEATNPSMNLMELLPAFSGTGIIAAIVDVEDALRVEFGEGAIDLIDENGRKGSGLIQNELMDNLVPIFESFGIDLSNIQNGTFNELHGSKSSPKVIIQLVEEPRVFFKDVYTFKFRVTDRTVTFVDHDQTVIGEQIVSYGSAATMPAEPTREGYSFTGWDQEFDIVRNDLTVIAQYSVNQYTITFDSTDGSEVEPITQDFETAITTPADPIREGYTFTGWQPAVPITMPAEDITLTAQWELIDTEAPVFDYIGEDEITIEYGSEFVVPDVNATDNVDKTVLVERVITDSEGKILEEINTSSAGNYIINYTVVDSAGNESQLAIIVIVESINKRITDIRIETPNKVEDEYLYLGYSILFDFKKNPDNNITAIKVELYDSENTLLSTTTGSENLITSVNDLTSGKVQLIAPFDLFYDFNYKQDGYWANDGWLGDKLNQPTKTLVTIEYKDGIAISDEHSVYNIISSDVIETKIAELEAVAKDVAKTDFISEFNTVVDKIKVGGDIIAIAGIDGENIKVTFETDDANLILEGAGVVFTALRGLASEGSTIEINEQEFILNDELNIIELAQAILGEGRVAGFLETGSLSTEYEASVIDKEGISFNLSGKLTFALDQSVIAARELSEAKAAAKDELDEYVDAEAYKENIEALSAAIAAGKEAIDLAETIEEVDAALIEAKAVIDKIISDTEIEAAEQVILFINSLPSVDKLTEEDREKIKEARAAFNSLTDIQKSLVSTETVSKLVEAEDEMARTVNHIGHEKIGDFHVVNRDYTDNKLKSDEIGTILLKIEDKDVTDDFTFKFYDKVGGAEIDSIDLSNGGTTIKIFMEATSEKYNDVSSEVVIKYGSVTIGTGEDTELLTIEDALNNAESDQTIVVRYNTSFTDVDLAQEVYGSATSTVKNGVTLLLPFDEEMSSDLKQTGSSGAGGLNRDSAYVELFIPESKTLDVNGILTVNAQQSAGTPRAGYVVGSNYSQLNMSKGSKINVNNGGEVNSIGFIFGEGQMEANPGGTVYDVLFISDFRGGTITSRVYSNVFPFDQYSFHNIEVPLTINQGAYYNAKAVAHASIVNYQHSDLPLIGDQDSESLLSLSSGNIVKNYDASSGKITFDFHGDVTVNDLSLRFAGQSVTTAGKEMPFAGNFQLNVRNGSKVTLNTGMKLLPGAGLTVDSGAELIISENGRLMVYDANEYTQSRGYPMQASEAYARYRLAPSYTHNMATPARFVLNGDLDLSGKIAGKVYSSNYGIINIRPSAATNLDIKHVEGNGDITTTNYKLKNYDGTVLDVLGIYQLNKDNTWTADIVFDKNDGSGHIETITQTYGSNYVFPAWYDSDSMFWYSASTGGEHLNFTDVAPSLAQVNRVYYNTIYARNIKDVIFHTISFAVNGGNQIEAIQVPDTGRIDPNVDHVPTKEKAVFMGWYMDEEFTVPYDEKEMIESDTTIYAYWLNSMEVNFELNGGIIDETSIIVSEGSIINPNKEHVPRKEGHTFVGWYSDKQLTEPYDSSYEVVEDITLYARWAVGELTIELSRGSTGNLDSGKTDSITATVIDSKGDPISGVVIEFTASPSTDATFNRVIDITNENGSVSTTFKGSGNANSDRKYTITATEQFTQKKGSISITVKSSPYLYSEDGEGNLYFEHEPFPLKMIKSVEGSSYATLRQLKGIDGGYYIQIVEEGTSITVLNYAQTYAVDYIDDGTVQDLFFDIDGNPHTIREKLRPISYVDQEGTSYLDEVLEKDGIAAATDIHYDSTVSYFTATFDQPNDNRYAKFMFSVKECGDSQEMLSALLASFDARQNLWWLDQALMNNETHQTYIQNIFDAFKIKVQVWNGSEWVTQANVEPSAYSFEQFLVELDLEGISLEQIQVRLLGPTQANYNYDDVSIDFTENLPMNVHEMSLETAVLNGEIDVYNLVSSIDNCYVNLSFKDGVRFGFSAPELIDGYSRGFGVETSGYIYDNSAQINDELSNQIVGKTFEEIKQVIINSNRQELIADIPKVEEFYYTILSIGSQNYETILDLLFGALE